MVRYVVGGTVLGLVLVLVGALLVGAEVNVTSINNQKHYGSGRYIVQVDDEGDGRTYTVVDSETGAAWAFNEDDGTLLLEPASDESTTP